MSEPIGSLSDVVPVRSPAASRLKTISGGAIGHFIEWFDWTIYATFSIYFAKVFFPAGNDVLAQINTAATYAQAFGMPVQIQLPQDLPPIGGTIATEGNAVRLDSYTPTELVRAVVAAGMQVAQQMQGGGRHPGGPGGL